MPLSYCFDSLLLLQGTIIVLLLIPKHTINNNKFIRPVTAAATFVQNSYKSSHHHHHCKKQQQQRNWQQQQQQQHHHHHIPTTTTGTTTAITNSFCSKTRNLYLLKMSSIVESETTNIQGIIFDLDGTLIDTEVLSDKALLLSINGLNDDIIIQQCNYRLPWELKQQILGLRGYEWAPIVLHYAVQHWNVLIEYEEDNDKKIIKQSILTKLFTDWETNLTKLCQMEVQLCVGANELVHSIASNYPNIPMAIATSSRYNSYTTKRTCVEEQQQSQQQQDNNKNNNNKSIFDNISIIICGDNINVPNGKPAPDIYLEASKQLNVSIQNCLVFEDALSGVQSAISAGCTNIVTIPDNRYSTQEKESIFILQPQQQNNNNNNSATKVKTVILNTLLDFDGTVFGLSKINLPLMLSFQKKIND